jgi:8-oxo-dGTP pyrophosphatase MutT (NUDIX family)
VTQAVQLRKERIEAGEVEVRIFDGYPYRRPAAAVLVALFEDGGEARVVLTRRAGHLRAHRGEVSFPGGQLDEGESPESGALREACEEVGILPESVEVIGRLRGMATMASGVTAITPVVGLLNGRPEYRANPEEVELAFDVSLAELASPGVFHEERWVRPEISVTGQIPGVAEDGSFPVAFFELEDDLVWGATGRMLVDLLELVYW